MSDNINNNRECKNYFHKTKQDRSIIIQGFVHQQLPSYFNIPQAIQDLIFDYYFFAHLQWNTKTNEIFSGCVFYIPMKESNGDSVQNISSSVEINSKLYSLLNDKNINEHEQQSKLESDQRMIKIVGKGTATVDYVISSKKYSEFDWEIIVDHTGFNSYIGFIDAPLKEVFPDLNSYSISLAREISAKHQYSIKILLFRQNRYTHYSYVRNCSPVSSGKRCELQLSKFGDKRERAIVKNGDRFRFHINFESKTCDVYINDILHFEEFFKGFGDEIIPAVSNDKRFAMYSLKTITPLL